MTSYSREALATRFVDSTLARDRCEWCRSPWRNLYRGRLCRSCYDKRTRLKQAERFISKLGSDGEPIPQLAHLEVRALRHAIANCKRSGKVLDGVLAPGSSALDLEHDLDWLSRRICHKKLFYGLATQLGWIFGPEHIRFLRCLIRKMIDTDTSRRRMERARSDAILGGATE